MIFNTEDVVGLLRAMLIDNSVVQDKEKADVMARAWLDTKMSVGSVELETAQKINGSVIDLMSLLRDSVKITKDGKKDITKETQEKLVDMLVLLR